MTPNHVKVVLDKLKDVEKHGDGWTARCPGHEDDRASLSVGIGDGGKILLHCHAGCAYVSIAKALGLDQKTKKSFGRIVKTYDYRNAAGTLLYQAVRFEPKDFRQRRPDGSGGWVWKMDGVKRVLYRLPELTAAPNDGVVFVVEGEKDADNLASLGLVATTNAGGAGKFKTVSDTSVLHGRRVAILPDNDKAGRDHAADVMKRLRGKAAEVRIVELPGLPDKGDVSDWLQASGTKDALLDLVAKAATSTPSAEQAEPNKAEKEGDTEAAYTDDVPPDLVENDADAEAGSNKEKRKSAATELVDLAADVELFNDGNDGVFCSIFVNGHHENYGIGTRAFRWYLTGLYLQEHHRAPGAQALQDAVNTISAKAKFSGAVQQVAVRMAEVDGRVYLDLANQDWQVVEITANGWSITTQPPVRFLRPRGVLALPVPVRGGRADALREFLNPGLSDDDWTLLASTLCMALRGRGPFPVLLLHGEQGSAKSTAVRLIRAILDPNKAPIRCEPKDPRDLMVAANNGYIVALDNLSHIIAWLSDALCRLATGGGFGTRELYSDSEETLFDAMRPCILNGIDDGLVHRSDLADRCVTITLPTIPEDKRRTERDLWERFNRERPAILGAFLSAVSHGLRTEGMIELDSAPRMMDFAAFAVACEAGLGLRPGSFMTAYHENRRQATETVIEGSPVAVAVLRFMDMQAAWNGTSTELLHALEADTITDPKTRQNRWQWPQSARTLSNILRRIAPNLRQRGIETTFHREGRNRSRLIQLEWVRFSSSASSAPSADGVGDAENTVSADDTRTQADDSRVPGGFHRPHENPPEGLKNEDADAADATDDRIPTHSCEDAEVAEWTA